MSAVVRTASWRDLVKHLVGWFGWLRVLGYKPTSIAVAPDVLCDLMSETRGLMWLPQPGKQCSPCGMLLGVPLREAVELPSRAVEIQYEDA